MTGTVRIIDLVSADGDKKFEPASRMAAAIIDIIRETGGCLPQNLNARGFTPDEVAKHWRVAKALTAVEMTLMNDNFPHHAVPLRRL